MISRIKNFLYSISFVPKINYPVYFVLKNNFFLRLPVLSRMFRLLCYHLDFFRRKLCYVGVNERIVEIPLVFQNITKPNSEILDVGCNESLLTLHMASLGHKVTALDLNGYGFSHPNIEVLKGDICTIDLPAQKYDYIIFLSVLEHVGLGAYGEEGFGGGDRKALERAKRFLKPDGKIIITTPFGKGTITPTQRVYSTETIAGLFSGFNVELEKYFKGIGQKEWIEAKKEDLAGVSSEQFTQGVAFFVLSL